MKFIEIENKPKNCGKFQEWFVFPSSWSKPIKINMAKDIVYTLVNFQSIGSYKEVVKE